MSNRSKSERWAIVWHIQDLKLFHPKWWHDEKNLFLAWAIGKMAWVLHFTVQIRSQHVNFFFFFYYLEQGWANFFCEWASSKYFRFVARKVSVAQMNSVIVAGKQSQTTVHEWAGLHLSNVLLARTSKWNKSWIWAEGHSSPICCLQLLAPKHHYYRQLKQFFSISYFNFWLYHANNA